MVASRWRFAHRIISRNNLSGAADCAFKWQRHRIYSDGLIDVLNSKGDEFGEERLVNCCRQLPKGASAESICTSLSQRVAEWSADAEQFDDTTILVLAVN
jgi:hypothetical protein